MRHRKVLYRLLFDVSSQTPLDFDKDLRYVGARPGIINVLHTRGQSLSIHTHIHCIVSGGGMVGESDWKAAWNGKSHFLFMVKAKNIVYRVKFSHYS